jgi:EAL domain-containing protein (putative c-di-GMP-specific phosphodiesterase class I)
VLIDGFGRVEEFVDLLEVPCVQYVKVHGSLTRSLAVNEVAAAKMQAILALATELEIAVIAECVEEPEVLARLKAMKVRYAQGFGICVPQPIDLILGLPAMRFSELRVEESSALAAQGTAEPGTSPQQEAAWSS